jgi:hypothetical protein
MSAPRFALPLARWLASGLAFAGTFAISSPALAAQGHPTTTINLCITKSGPDKGSVRFIQEKLKCRSGELRVRVVGDSGQQGVPAFQEGSGEPTPSGFPDLQGETGAWGDQGLPGLRGPAGENGKDGTDGAPGKDGIDGQDGATGPQGPEGPEGAQGPAGATEYLRVDGATSADDENESKTAIVTCPGGRSVLSGGWSIAAADQVGVDVTRSEASSNDTWTVTGNVDDPSFVGKWSIQAHAVCALVSP